MSIKLSLSLLPFRLYICRFSFEHLKEFTHQICQIVLRRNEQENSFFCFTETQEGVSLILDEHLFKLFPTSTKFEVSIQTWRALQVNEGSLGYTSTGIICQLARPLSDMSIFNISTWGTDYTLVPEKHIWSAIHKLEKDIGTVDGKDELNQIIPEKDEPESITSKKSDVKFKLNHFKEELFIRQVNLETVEQCESAILRILLHIDQSENKFEKRDLICVTMTQEEVTIVAPKKIFDIFPSETLSPASDPWEALRIGSNLGFEETGIVASVTSAVSQIGLFYISAYSSDYILVGKKDSKTALQKFKDNGFEIRE